MRGQAGDVRRINLVKFAESISARVAIVARPVRGGNYRTVAIACLAQQMKLLVVGQHLHFAGGLIEDQTFEKITVGCLYFSPDFWFAFGALQSTQKTN